MTDEDRKALEDLIDVHIKELRRTLECERRERGLEWGQKINNWMFYGVLGFLFLLLVGVLSVNLSTCEARWIVKEESQQHK
jgi:hypothetical protein